MHPSIVACAGHDKTAPDLERPGAVECCQATCGTYGGRSRTQVFVATTVALNEFVFFVRMVITSPWASETPVKVPRTLVVVLTGHATGEAGAVPISDPFL